MPRRKLDWVQYELKRWDGCQLLSASPVFIIADTLLQSLASADVRGIEHCPIDVSFDQQFEVAGFSRVAVPRLWLMTISGLADGPWVRHTRGAVCTHCGGWSSEALTAEQSDALMEEILGDRPPRASQVYAHTWHGEDIFELTEPGLPVITDRFAVVLRDTGNLKPGCCELRPAEWVS